MKRDIFYVTGKTGSGKTSVCKELVRRGCCAFDLDRGGLTHWRNRKTGSVVKPDTQAIDAKFNYENRYEMNLDAVLEEIDRQEERQVFVCGSVTNRRDFLPHWTKAFYLKCTPAMLMERLNRPDRNYAKSSDHQRDIVESTERTYLAFEDDGILPINADLPLNQVVDEIISRTKE